MTEQVNRFKCHICHVVFREDQIENAGTCPNCGATSGIEKMCELDHTHCNCGDVIEGLKYCPICGRACCPICGSHDVVQVSRVTGYLADVAGWNAGKAQELKDRKRSNVA